MAAIDGHNCGCYSREEIELSEGVRPIAVLIDEDCCDCECNEVELHTNREPDVILFEEYCDEYADDIVAAKEAAEAAKQAVDTNSAIIIAKENLLLDDHQTIKRELRQGFANVLASVASEANSIRAKIVEKATEILSSLTDKYNGLRDHATSLYNSLKGIVENKASATDALITTSTDEIRSDIADIKTQLIEECSEADIYAIFEDDEAES